MGWIGAFTSGAGLTAMLVWAGMGGAGAPAAPSDAPGLSAAAHTPTGSAQTSMPVVEAVSAEGDLLLSNGVVVRLAGLETLPPEEDGAPGPEAERRRALLEELALSRPVKLVYGGLTTDRDGRAVAQAFVALGDREVWLQERLLRDGAARVRTWPHDQSFAASLLAAEGEARRAGKGVWAGGGLRVRDASDPWDVPADGYHVVEGRVVSAMRLRDGRIYLNFGDNYRTDVTLKLKPEDRASFPQRGEELLALEGKKVRARGFVYEENGPLIRLTHVSQIEALD